MNDNKSVSKKPFKSFKIIVLGESNVGKSSLFLRYTQDLFKEAIANTIGIDNTFKELIINGDPMMLQLWDTAGQERFRSIVSAYYRESDGIIFVYDLTTERSFEYMVELIDEIKDVVDLNYAVIVGNKMDCVTRAEIKESEDRVKFISEKYKIRHYLCSAKTGEKVNEIFEELAKKLYHDKGTKKEEKTKIELKRAKRRRRFWCVN